MITKSLQSTLNRKMLKGYFLVQQSSLGKIIQFDIHEQLFSVVPDGNGPQVQCSLAGIVFAVLL